VRRPTTTPQGAKRVAEQQIAAGADVIFGMGDGASFGMLQAVEEHNVVADDAVRFIDVIGDKRADYGDALLTSVLFDYTDIYRQMVADLEAGTFGSVYTMDLQNGGVRLLDLPDEVPAEARASVAAAEREIVEGQLAVSAVGDADGVRQRLDELFPG
jgi:simple sugar transport system substrate-binding protein